MEHRNQLRKWGAQVAECEDSAVADMDVAKRLLKHGMEALDEIEKLRGGLEKANVLIREQNELARERQEHALKMTALLHAMQNDAVKYLEPDNECGAEWFVSRMLEHLDGPAQREAMKRPNGVGQEPRIARSPAPECYAPTKEKE